MKLTWLLIPIALAGLSSTHGQAAKIGTITIPANHVPDASEQERKITAPAPASPIILRAGVVPLSERRNLQKPPLPKTSKTLVATSGPLPASDQQPDRNPKKHYVLPLSKTLEVTATIYDALWDNEVDYDKDGYKQSARLVWDPDVVGSAGSLDVYEKIYRKVSTSRFWGLVTTTSSHTITGTSDADQYFLQVYGSAHDLFDWRIDIYRVGQTTSDNSRDPSIDPDLDNYPLETPDEDAIATIYDAWWTNEIDCDGDGYKSSARLVWDPDVVGSSGSLTVHEVISRKYYADPNWSLYSQTLPHTITGNSPDDPSFIDFAPFYSKSALFDFKIDIYREGEGNADATRDPSNDADLNDYGTEAGPLDGLRAGIADVWWSGNVDNDGDGYRQSAWLHWDPDVIGGTSYLLVDCRVSYKLSESSQWQVKVDQFSTINGSTRADAESLNISLLPHGLYDWKIEAYSDWNAAPDVVRQPSNEPLLGGFAMELPEEDGTTAVDETGFGLPRDYVLMQNYPNPFNPSTSIRFALPVRSVVKLEVFNTLGQLVSTLVSNEMTAGYHEATFHTKDASGFCFYRLEAFPVGNPERRIVETRKMVILK
jgi:hypothetical protein